jgi:hypothetical protein
MGYRWFVRNNLAGGDYQAAMDTQVAAGRVEDARWLLENFGSTNTCWSSSTWRPTTWSMPAPLIVHGDVRVPGQLLVGRSLQGGGIRAGKLEAGEDSCGGAIFAGELLQAGGIKAAWSVEVQGELRAEDLRTGWELRCGGHVDLKGNAHIGQEVEVQGAALRQGPARGGRMAVQGLLDGAGIAAANDILCGNHIQAGWGIKAQGDIRAACSIRAGETLQADGEIAAGPGYGVFAGMNVQMRPGPTAPGCVRSKSPRADQRLLGRPALLRLNDIR